MPNSPMNVTPGPAHDTLVQRRSVRLSIEPDVLMDPQWARGKPWLLNEIRVDWYRHSVHDDTWKDCRVAMYGWYAKKDGTRSATAYNQSYPGPVSRLPEHVRTPELLAAIEATRPPVDLIL